MYSLRLVSQYANDDVGLSFDTGQLEDRAFDASVEWDIYTITYEVVDDCGNSTIGTATVTVPLNNH